MQGTLSDEAGNELLLLYGSADATLEVALVEHCDWVQVVSMCDISKVSYHNGCEHVCS